MKKRLLFATFSDARVDQGFSYAMELAKTMDKDLSILLLKNNGISAFDKLMSAITFAEAGEHETAREFLSKADEGKVKGKLGEISEKCKTAGITLSVYSSSKEILPAIGDYMRERNGIEMILLAPNITGYVSERKLKKLLDLSAKPVVKISQPACAN